MQGPWGPPGGVAQEAAAHSAWELREAGLRLGSRAAPAGECKTLRANEGPSKVVVQGRPRNEPRRSAGPARRKGRWKERRQRGNGQGGRRRAGQGDGAGAQKPQRCRVQHDPGSHGSILVCTHFMSWGQGWRDCPLPPSDPDHSAGQGDLVPWSEGPLLPAGTTWQPRSWGE